jgi:replicative DNA helicase
MLTIADNIARTGKKVLFASTEMGITPVLERHIAKTLRISVRNFRRREFQLDADMEKKFFSGSGELESIPVYYLFGSRSSESIWQNARKMQEQYGLDAIFVDYLQLLTDCRRGKDNHAVQVGLVSHNLKDITKDLNVPVVVASQLNRLLEYRESKRPMLADLRESGDIEQDADVVFLLHRPELYPECPAGDRGVLEMMMAKNRQLGTAESPVRLQWIPEQYRYGNAVRY